MAQVAVAADRAAVVGRARLSRRDELVTVALGTWLMVGLFVDGWAHNNLAQLETFLTPWHGLFYSGFTAVAAWVCWQVVRGQQTGRRGLAAVPLGYGLGLAGVATFAAGGVGDASWHTLFGIEQDIDALFSPTHLLLFVGIALIVSSPLRAAWTTDPADAAPRYRDFLPVLLSATLLATLVSFMFLYFSAFLTRAPTAEAVGLAARSDTEAVHVTGLLVQDGIGSVFTTNLVLLAPLLLLAKRWHVPFGTVTTLVTAVAVLTSVIDEFRAPWLVVAAVAAGLMADLALRWLRPSAGRPGAYWAAGLVVPLLLWSAWFAAVGLAEGIGWSLELWTGTILWSGLIGLALGMLMLPPRAASGP